MSDQEGKRNRLVAEFSNIRADVEFVASDSFPFGLSPEMAQHARQEAIRFLWDKRSMLPEQSEEIVDDVLAAVLPILMKHA